MGMRTPTAPATDHWMETVNDLPALSGPADRAVRLLLLVHYSVDWDAWIANYRMKYWDSLLIDRVVVASYRAGTLRGWWSVVAQELPLSVPPRLAREVEVLVSGGDDQAVLSVMRAQAEGLVLRVRVTAEAVREARKEQVSA